MKKLLNGLTSVENVIMVAAFAIMVICTSVSYTHLTLPTT